MSWLVATGLKREAGLIAGGAVAAIPGGGDAARLAVMLEAGVRDGATAILSSGLAGALDPALAVGDIVLDGDPALVARLAAILPQARAGGIVGSATAVASVEAKAALGTRTGARVVDMETHVAAQIAAHHALPFAALRIVSDTAQTALPPAALVGMAPDGGMALGAVLAALARRPGQLPALLRTGRDAGVAFGALGQSWQAIRATLPG